MALYVHLLNQYPLVEQINKLIDKGIISTWDYDNDGDYTHLPTQWKDEAWMHFHMYNDINNIAIFSIIARRDIPLSKTIYAVFHGRFAEMLLTHFDKQIEYINISSMLINGIDKF